MNVYTADELVLKCVEYLKGLPAGTQISTVETVNKIVDKKHADLYDLMDIHFRIMEEAGREGIMCASSAYGDMVIGTPYNIPYIISYYDDKTIDKILIITDAVANVMPRKDEEVRSALLIDGEGRVTYSAYPYDSAIEEESLLRSFRYPFCEEDLTAEDVRRVKLLRREETILNGKDREEIFGLIGKTARFHNFEDLMMDGGRYAIAVFYEDGTYDVREGGLSDDLYTDDINVSDFLSDRIDIENMLILSFGYSY